MVLVTLWPSIEGDPVAAGVLAAVLTMLAVVYFVRRIWPGGRPRR